MTGMRQRLESIEAERRRRQQVVTGTACQEGQLTARERVARLLDPGSFQEIDLWSDAYKTGFPLDAREIPGDGVITGWGEVNGSPVYVWAQDPGVLEGSVGEIHAAKIVRVMEKALTERVPVVGMHDSIGVRPESAATAHGYCNFGTMMRFQTLSSGVIPQIALVMGPCLQGAALSAALNDFVFMVKGRGRLHVAQPPPDVPEESYGSASMHARTSGCCDVLAQDDEECLSACRILLGFLPLNNSRRPPVMEAGDPPDRADEALLDIVPEPGKWFDIRRVIRHVVDQGAYFEVKKDYAPNLSLGFARFAGQPVGIIANNSMYKGGCEDVYSSDKHARFTRFCDAFNLPLVYFADCPGFLPGVEQERMGILRHGTMVIHSTCEATVPRISIFVRKVYGGAQLAMPSNYSKVDRMLAWPSVERGTMGPEGLAAVMYKGRLDRAQDAQEKKRIWQEAVSRMEQTVARFSRVANEDYIDPRQTRPLIIKALQCTHDRVKDRPARKHENINL